LNSLKKSKKSVSITAIHPSSNQRARRHTSYTGPVKSLPNAMAAFTQTLLTIIWHEFKEVQMDIHNITKTLPDTPAKSNKISTTRMKDIISQLSDVIYLLCSAKSEDITTIFDQFTNITSEERDALHIIFPNDADDDND